VRWELERSFDDHLRQELSYQTLNLILLQVTIENVWVTFSTHSVLPVKYKREANNIFGKKFPCILDAKIEQQALQASRP